MNTLYIHTNNKQLFGAVISKFSFEKACGKERCFDIKIINVDEEDRFNRIFGKHILMNGSSVFYSKDDLQSFTLSRFLPPEISDYQGLSYVIDPDIFCVSGKFNDIFNTGISKSIGAIFHNGKYLSSSMLLKNSELKHWRIDSIIDDLVNRRNDYRYYMNLEFEQGNIEKIEKCYNDLDNLTQDTVLLHNTNRLTQPWKTGLKVDFRREPMRPIFGFIPRELVHTALGRRKFKYQDHTDERQVNLFVELVKSALSENFISKEFIETEINKKNIRPDMLRML